MTHDSTTPFDVRWSQSADRSGGPDACWPWLGKGINGGYGRIRYQGRMWYAHRLAFYLAHGRILPEAVCHRCDNPPCVNPTHLREGTLADNTAEMWAKGRARAHYTNGKLTKDQVAYILSMGRARGYQRVADECGVSKRTVYRLFFGPVPKIYRRVAKAA